MDNFLTESEKESIRETVAAAKQGIDKLVDDFYTRLFDLEPSLRPLFATDLSDQKKKLVSMLVSIVSLLDKPEQLLVAARALGKRHTAYGVSREDFEPVGNALIGALASAAADQWDFDKEQAWVHLYSALTAEMLSEFS
ncbi:MAG: hemin receptor [Aquabacterium sp.]|uniref:globin domain-containing protein n=1 Tax=Aquabacterium sp. TaxID=1872578 RepID=UPI0025BAABD5|nr:globin domain-containing protein [Aquabacterium sp.]MBI5927180.1 hemin receptor [Aquabacterium sp.]